MTRPQLKCQCHLCQQNLAVLMFLSLPLWFTRSFAVMFLKGVCLPERDNEDVDAVSFVFQWSGLLCCYFCYWCSKWNCKSCEHGEKLVAGVFIIANRSEDDLTVITRLPGRQCDTGYCPQHTSHVTPSVPFSAWLWLVHSVIRLYWDLLISFI